MGGGELRENGKLEVQYIIYVFSNSMFLLFIPLIDCDRDLGYGAPWSPICYVRGRSVPIQTSNFQGCHPLRLRVIITKRRDHFPGTVIYYPGAIFTLPHKKKPLTYVPGLVGTHVGLPCAGLPGRGQPTARGRRCPAAPTWPESKRSRQEVRESVGQGTCERRLPAPRSVPGIW